MLINSGGLEWAEDTFMNVSVGREELRPLRVPGEEISSSTSSATARQGTGGINDEGIESVGEGGENVGTAVVSIRLRVLHQIGDRTMFDHDTLRFAGTPTAEPVRKFRSHLKGMEGGKPT